MAEAHSPPPGTGFDSFPYRQTLSAVMRAPPVSIAATATLEAAARLMTAGDVSSVLAADGDGLPVGILTERDLLRALAQSGGAATTAPVSTAMSAPLVTLPADAFVYQGLGRMERLGIRHLALTGADGRVVGVVSARALLRSRATRSFAIGDGIAAAASAAETRACRDELPGLAAALLADATPGPAVARLISQVMRDTMARAGALALAAMAADGLGDPPVPWCLLILGSGGRGESLLAPDQDTALVWGDGGGPDADAWFADFGRRVSDLLDASGVPYCKGGVMAMNEAWRGSLPDWRTRVGGWIGRGAGGDMLNVGIFFDFAPVLGDRALAESLRSDALAAAGGARRFLGNLGQALAPLRAPLGWDAFGLLSGIRTVAGRVDLKMGGTLPLVAAGRILALRHGDAPTATAARYQAMVEAGHIPAADAEAVAAALDVITTAALRQQVADIAAGIAPSYKVALAALSRRERRALRDALLVVDVAAPMVTAALAG